MAIGHAFGVSEGSRPAPITRRLCAKLQLLLLHLGVVSLSLLIILHRLAIPWLN